MWNGCKSNTLVFIQEYFDSDKIFTISEISAKGNLVLKEFNEYFVNYKLFNLVPCKEMTIAEIEEELGYQIKVVKEEE